MTDRYTVQDLVKFSHNQQPIDFENAFNDILTYKLADAVGAKKQEMAQGIFPDEDQDISDEAEEDSEEDFETDTEGHQDDQDS